MRPTVRHIEIDGAIAHPLCNGPQRIAQAVYIADCRPYHDDTDRARAHIAYYLANGITEPMIRADMGQTFGGVFTDANCPLYAQEPAADLAAGYASGCLNYRKRVLLGSWMGCEFDRFCHIGDLFEAAGLEPVLLFDIPGESTLDLWGADPNAPQEREYQRRAAQVIAGLAASPRALHRGMPMQVDSQREDWDKLWPFARGVMNKTCARLVDDSPFNGCPFIVSGSCAVEIVRDDGRTQPPCEMQPNQISHNGAYDTRDAATAACIDAKHRHEDSPWASHYALNLDLEDCTPEQVAARDRFGTLDHSIIWGNPQDLPKLNAFAAALAGSV